MSNLNEAYHNERKSVDIKYNHANEHIRVESHSSMALSGMAKHMYGTYQKARITQIGDNL